MSLTNNLLRFVQSLKLIFAAFMVGVIAFVMYSAAQRSLQVANELRYRSLLLTQELRQSSDDLTRMVRSYVVTSDVRYRDHFDEISGIRDGLKPRPQQYENVYWDLVLDERRPTPMGPPSSLLQRMSEAGFTQEELNRLDEAKANSDILIDIERQAMKLIETHEPGSDAVPHDNPLAAIRMLHEATYYRAKADIMRPIAEVNRMVEARTKSAVESAERHSLQMQILFMLSGMLVVIVLWWTNRNLNLVFGGSARQLHDVVKHTASSSAVTAAPKGNGDRDSIIGKLLEEQQVRSSAESQRKVSERALTEAERRFRTLVEELTDGVCVVQDALIRFVNPRMVAILEQPETELIDRPFIEFVHADDRLPLMERYRKRMEGSAVDPDSIFRICTGQGALRKIMSRGSLFEWSGRPATLVFITSTE